ncbi:MAG: ribonuclease HII [bacterium]
MQATQIGWDKIFCKINEDVRLGRLALFTGFDLKNHQETDERERIRNMLAYEQELWNKGFKYIAGLDESGRGPLAGPVVAAAVIFPKDIFVPRIDDSKKLSSVVRESLYDIIVEQALDYGLGLAEVAEIDRINIYQATFLAMERALDKLSIRPEHLLVDGRAFPNDNIPYTTIVKGDSKCYSIAAASILAKVIRDRLMREYDAKYPEYGFARHKGYPTPGHLDALEKFGACPIHRQSFHPKRFLEALIPSSNHAE